MDSPFVNEVLSVLDDSDKAKVRAMFANYQIGDGFEDAYELMKYQLNQNNAGFENAGFAVQAHMIVEELEPYLAEKQRKTAPVQKKIKQTNAATFQQVSAPVDILMRIQK